MSGKILPHNRVFIGDDAYSVRFSRAVDLGAREKNGLVYQTIRKANGDEIRLHGDVQWFLPLRTVRVVWDLGVPEARDRAKHVRDAIWNVTGYDLLRGLV